jgi:D-inositol-3-phosphate glycosyltransferase
MTAYRLAFFCVHTSPLAPLGGKKTGGMNVYVRELAAELGRQGHAIDIFTRRHSADLSEVDLTLAPNVRVIHVNAGPLRVLDPDEVYPHLQQFTAGVIAFAMRTHTTYDLSYSHYWLSGWVAQKLKETWNTPFVQMFHTLGQMKHRIAHMPTADLPAGAVPLVPFGDVRTRTEGQIMGWADRLIAATPAESAQLVWLYRADPRKIEIVPPGVNTMHFYPQDYAAAKHTLGLSDQEQQLLFVGRIEPLKAVDTILHALDHLRTNAPSLLSQAHLAIVGGDVNEAPQGELLRLHQLRQTLSLEQQVRFLGAKDHSELQTYYGASTALLMPSDYESFGMVALEAMASGAPVIASQVGGLAFLVRDGETGYLVPVRDPSALAARMGQLLGAPEQRATLGAAAAHHAQSYAWPQIAERLLNIFSAVLAGRPRQRMLRLG